MNQFHGSDFHFFHTNIIKYENRPFKNVEEMNETIICKHNERVKPGDLYYFHGDWGFYASKQKEFRGEGMNNRVDELKKRLNGTIISVRGNHDKSQNKLNIPNHRIILNKGGMYIQLTHKVEDAVIYDYSYYYPLIICGHAHGKWQTKEVEKDGYVSLAINVSVENNNYYPFEFNEIMSIFHRWLNGRPDKEEIKKKIEICNHRKMYVREQ